MRRPKSKDARGEAVVKGMAEVVAGTDEDGGLGIAFARDEDANAPPSQGLAARGSFTVRVSLGRAGGGASSSSTSGKARCSAA